MQEATQRRASHPPEGIRPVARRPGRRCLMDGISYDVRIWAIETYRGTKVTTYKVRWKVGPRPWKRSFRIVAQADSFRAELLAAARRGEAFAIETGLPASWRRDNLAV